MSTTTASNSTTPNERTKPSRVWLIATAALFFAWIGFLAYLAVTTRQPVVLSRPQFLVSQLDVVAQVDDAHGPTIVQEVLYPKDKDSREFIGAALRVVNLASCRCDGGQPGEIPAGLYLLPLVHVKDRNAYQVVRTPRSPGYQPGTPIIYSVSPQVRAQYRQIHKHIVVVDP